MPTASQTPPIHVLRSILRHIKKSSSSTTTPTTPTSTNPLYNQVMNQYKKYQHLSPTSTKCIQLRQMAYNYYILKNDLKERNRLHLLDGGVESKLSPKEMSRRAAARAGLLLPEEHTD